MDRWNFEIPSYFLLDRKDERNQSSIGFDIQVVVTYQSVQCLCFKLIEVNRFYLNVLIYFGFLPTLDQNRNAKSDRLIFLQRCTDTCM